MSRPTRVRTAPKSTGAVDQAAARQAKSPTETGTTHFTSSDSVAVLPANYTFTSADGGIHAFTGGLKLKTVGTQWARATDAVTATITGVRTGIVVSP